MGARFALTFIGLVALASAAAWHQQQPADPKILGRLFSPIGTLLQKQKLHEDWKLPEIYAPVHEGDTLLTLPGARADLQFKEGDVRVSLRGNLPEGSFGGLLESTLILRAPSKADVDFTLLRGRVVFENHHEKGPARIHLWTQSMRSNPWLKITLEDRASVVAVEFFNERLDLKGKHLRQHANVIILKGKTRVGVGDNEYVAGGTSVMLLSAPPPPTFSGKVEVPDFKETPFPSKLPPWATSQATAATRTALAAVESLRRQIAAPGGIRNISKVIEKDDTIQRRVRIVSAGAVDNLPFVISGLDDEKSSEARRAAIAALRQWLHRGGSADVQLYKALVDYGVPRAQADIVVNLLRGSDDAELGRASFYSTLISHLDHSQLVIRELARFRLYLLVPQGQNIAYDAAGSPEQRAQAQAAWRRLIPPGQVPQSLKSEK